MEHTTYFSNPPPILPNPKANTGAGWLPSAQQILIRVSDAIFTWEDRSRERRHLGALDDRLLHDIGVDRASANTEAAKPFWRS